MCIVAQRISGCKLKIAPVPIKFCAAKQRIKVLEKSSSYSPRSVVCVGVAESEKGDDTHGKAQTVR